MASESQLNKIEALLRKAESTNHPAEAETFTAKAEELMAKWSIEGAQLRAARTAGDAAADIDTIEVIVWKSAMSAGLNTLLAILCEEHDCRAIYRQARRFYPSGRSVRVEGDQAKQRLCRSYTVHGFPEDLRSVEMLYASLQLQASRAYQSDEVRAARVAECGDGKSAGGKAIAFKNAFMVSYAHRVAQRIHDARRSMTTSSTALVLANQKAMVDLHFELAYGANNLKPGKANTGGSRSSRGHSLGRAAADNANLGGSYHPSVAPGQG